jgi:Cu-Zn family superoxide dismutase
MFFDNYSHNVIDYQKYMYLTFRTQVLFKLKTYCRPWQFNTLICLLGFLSLTGCQLFNETPRAVSIIQAKSGSSIQGSVNFLQSSDKVQVTGTFSGLVPNSEHGIHIHEIGDCSAIDASSAGGHYNPMGTKHGKHDNSTAHAGDMPNLKADQLGNAYYVATLNRFSLLGDQTILGRSVVLHQDRDDYVSQPAGNSGLRIGCGIIR